MNQGPKNKSKAVKILSKPEKFVDTCSGNTQYLIGSGMKPVYKFKKNYAQIPRYLKKQPHHEYAGESSDIPKLSENLGKKEKFQIIRGLKKNWDLLNKEYQSLSVIIDTPAKRRRKEHLENCLDSLENDLTLLKNSSKIIVA